MCARKYLTGNEICLFLLPFGETTCENRIGVTITVPRFWKADAERVWRSFAIKRSVGHYRKLSRSQRVRLRRLLKEARCDSHLNQKQAAEQLGQDQSFISKIESGKRQVEFVEVEQLAQIYRKQLAFFDTLSCLQQKEKRSKGDT